MSRNLEEKKKSGGETLKKSDVVIRDHFRREWWHENHVLRRQYHDFAFFSKLGKALIVRSTEIS